MNFKYAAIALSLISNLAMAQNFTVKSQLQQADVLVDGISVKLDSQVVNKDSTGEVIAVGAKADFSLTGRYATSWCTIDNLLMRISPDKTIQFPNEGGEIHFIGTSRTKTNQPIELSNKFCAGGSSGTLTTPFSVTVQSWPGTAGQKQKTWTYKIVTGFSPNSLSEQVLTIVFDINSGWSFSLK